MKAGFSLCPLWDSPSNFLPHPPHSSDHSQLISSSLPLRPVCLLNTRPPPPCPHVPSLHLRSWSGGRVKCVQAPGPPDSPQEQ
jgi:hypothetical protein